MSYKNKNYLKKSLLNQKKWGKISNYCDSNYKKFWEYQECEAQNTKAYKMYNKAKDIYDVYLSYGELLSFQVLGGEISEQQARYYQASKRDEIVDKIVHNRSAKWNNFVNNMMKIENTFNNFNRNQTVPQNTPTMNGHRICQLQHSGGNAAVSNIICF